MFMSLDRRRTMIFLRERFPPGESLFSFIQSFLGLIFLDLLTGVSGAPSLPLTAIFAMALTITGFLFLIRVADDLKDHAIDQRLFPHRALARGDVRPEDIRGAAVACLSLLISLQVLLFASPQIGAPSALVFAGCIGFIFLMWKWFYAERRIRASLPLAFVTHNPVSLWIGLYAVSPFLFREGAGTALAFFLAGNSAFAAAWEIARKIRNPAKETDYVTYSKLWGPRIPALITLVCLLVALVGFSAPLWLARGFVPSLWLLVGAGSFALVWNGWFLARPERARPPSTSVEVAAVSVVLFLALNVLGHAHELGF